MSGGDEGGGRSDLASLKRIWALVGPLRGKLARGIGFRFAQSVALGLSFAIVIWVLGGLADGQAITTTWAWQATGLMLASLLGQALFSFAAVSHCWIASYEVAGQLRLLMLDHLKRLPMSFHLSRHKGDTLSVLTSDMQMLEVFLSDGLPKVAQALGLPLAILVFLVMRDWLTALVAMVSIAAGLPFFLWSSRWLSVLGTRRQDVQAKAAGQMVEFAQGMGVIRAFNRQGQASDGFRTALEAFHAISVGMVLQLTAPLIAFSGIVMLGIPMMIVAIGWRLAGGEITAGTAVALLGLLTSTYAPFVTLVGVMESARLADAALVRMDRVLSAQPFAQPAVPRSAAGFAIAFDAVGFGYDAQTPVLHDVSFRVPEHSMLALVGPSGSGKSTVLNLLARFWEPHRGSISIGGVPLADMDDAQLNGLITVVFQDVYLFSGSIFDNIAMGRPGATPADVQQAARKAQAHDFVSALPEGYHTTVGEGGATLSGGERQRIAIARAILKDAPIVLLDEVTSALDATNERALQLALAELVSNKTLIVVAHKLSTIQAADQIVVLEHGRVVETGQHEALATAQGLYALLWQARLKADRWRLT